MSSVDFHGLYGKVCTAGSRPESLPSLLAPSFTVPQAQPRHSPSEPSVRSGVLRQDGEVLQGRGKRDARPQGAPKPERGGQRGRSLEEACDNSSLACSVTLLGKHRKVLLQLPNFTALIQSGVHRRRDQVREV